MQPRSGAEASASEPSPSDADAGSTPAVPPRAPHRGGLRPPFPLAIGALGVVFGDIGTSPLYSLQTVFSAEHNAVAPDRTDIFGVISMVIWAITVIVTYKYVFLVMRADNEGDGGILALVALLRERLSARRHLAGAAVFVGIIGAALFYGDSLITPAISVMSAFEGLSVVNHSFESLVMPLSMGVLAVLFAVQRFGTAKVGLFFGPVMALWFGTIALLGIPQIVRNPEILLAVSPHYALQFAASRPFVAFIAMGAVVLTITGAEALYADMGHFGAPPIRMAWFFLVFPALAVNYFGQGALLLSNPAAIDNPFFRLAPDWARIPLVILATLATVIASQAVISGAYSVSRQANRLGLLPRLNIKHTSKEEGGQIYIGTINWILFVGVLLLVGIFQTSTALASAYGLAVTGTLILTTILFMLLAHYVWRVAAWKLIVAGVVIGAFELTFLAANLTKVLHGGWIPLVIAAVIITIMTTWRRGIAHVHAQRDALEGPLDDFLAGLRRDGVRRIPGLAVFPHPDLRTTPLAMRQNVAFNQTLHEKVAIVSIINENVPHIRHVDRVSVDNLGFDDDGIVQIKYRVGFNDSQDVPKALEWAKERVGEFELDPSQARYFLSSLRLRGTPRISSLRDRIFLSLARYSADRTQAFGLPPERTIVIGGELRL